MFEIEITKNFSAAHQLKNYNGDCSRLHGHNWIVKVTARAEKLDNIGIAYDFRKLKQSLDNVIASLDHSNLNDLPHFEEQNPSSELIAQLIYHEMSKIVNDENVKIAKVSVAESQDSVATYYE